MTVTSLPTQLVDAFDNQLFVNLAMYDNVDFKSLDVFPADLKLKSLF